MLRLIFASANGENSKNIVLKRVTRVYGGFASGRQSVVVSLNVISLVLRKLDFHLGVGLFPIRTLPLIACLIW